MGVLAGVWLGRVVPPRLCALVSGLLLVAFGAASLRRGAPDPEDAGWGGRAQLTVAAMSAVTGRPWSVLAAALAAEAVLAVARGSVGEKTKAGLFLAGGAALLYKGFLAP